MTIGSGPRRRWRRWSAAAKARLVAQALTPGARVAAVAQRHAVSTSQLYAWCRAARDDGSRKRLVPVVVDDAVAPGVVGSTAYGEIEIALARDVRVVVRGTVEASALRNVLLVLRG